MSELVQRSGPSGPIDPSTHPQQPTQTSTTTPDNKRQPTPETLLTVWRLSLIEDKPIKSDYWEDSINKVAYVAKRRSTEERILVKNQHEFTSPILNAYRLGNDVILSTVNSYYIVDHACRKEEIP